MPGHPTPAELAEWFAPWWPTMQAFSISTLTCSVCGRELHRAGLAAIRFMPDGSLRFLCSAIDCADDFWKPF